MLPSLLPNFPHLRRPPDHVVRGLRAVDPTADLVYVGWGRWILLSVRPNREHRASGERILANAGRLLSLWEKTPKLRANPGAFRRLINRYDYGLMTAMGARPITEYKVQGEPTSAIVDDFRRMDYLFRTTSDQALDEALHADKEAARTASRADLTDPARHNAASTYLFSRSHDFGARVGQDLGPRSGFKREAITATLSS